MVPRFPRSIRPVMPRPMRRFWRDEDGALVLAEFLIVLPLLLWVFFALFVYWDSFRAVNQAQKATYAISDAISREGDVTPAYLDGMANVLELLAPNAPDYRLRITSIQWNQNTGAYVVLFSRSPGGRLPALTPAQVMAKQYLIPTMTHGGSVVIVESYIDYVPPLNVGILQNDIENFIVTRPRVARRSCLTTSPGTCPSNL